MWWQHDVQEDEGIPPRAADHLVLFDHEGTKLGRDQRDHILLDDRTLVHIEKALVIVGLGHHCWIRLG